MNKKWIEIHFMAKWLLLDGFNLTFRSFYAIPELARSDGFPTNALHGWVKTVWYLQDSQKPDHIAAFFDLEGSAVRQALMPEYKIHRKEMPDSLRVQIPWVKKITAAMGIPVIEKAGVEADDILASAAVKLAEEGHEVLIVSADKDMAQVIRPGISQLLPPPTVNLKLGWRVLDEEGVFKKFGVRTDQIVDYLSLIGDASDNIPGLEGVGPKTAAKWIAEYGSLEGIIDKVNYIMPARFQVLIPERVDLLRKNVQMIKLRTDLEEGAIVESKPDVEGLVGIFELMEMKTAVKEVCKRFGDRPLA